MYLPVRLLGLIETAILSLGGLGAEPPPPLHPASHLIFPRMPLTEAEPLHHCPQLEALQQQVRLLEEENQQLREEDKGRG